jgi:hypothetical protein
MSVYTSSKKELRSTTTVMSSDRSRANINHIMRWEVQSIVVELHLHTYIHQYLMHTSRARSRAAHYFISPHHLGHDTGLSLVLHGVQLVQQAMLLGGGSCSHRRSGGLVEYEALTLADAVRATGCNTCAGDT